MTDLLILLQTVLVTALLVAVGAIWLQVARDLLRSEPLEPPSLPCCRRAWEHLQEEHRMAER